MTGFPSVTYTNIRISASLATPTALYAFYGVTGSQTLKVCSPIGVNCNFVTLTAVPQNLVTQYQQNIVLLADPNVATRAYIGGFKTYLRVDNVNFVAATATYTSIYGAGFTGDGSVQHADGRVMIMDANGDLLEGDRQTLTPIVLLHY